MTAHPRTLMMKHCAAQRAYSLVCRCRAANRDRLKARINNIGVICTGLLSIFTQPGAGRAVGLHGHCQRSSPKMSDNTTLQRISSLLNADSYPLDEMRATASGSSRLMIFPYSQLCDAMTAIRSFSSACTGRWALIPYSQDACFHQLVQ